MLLFLEQRPETPWLFVQLIVEVNRALSLSPPLRTNVSGFIHKIFSYRDEKTRSGVCKYQIICKYLLFLSLKQTRFLTFKNFRVRTNLFSRMAPLILVNFLKICLTNVMLVHGKKEMVTLVSMYIALLQIDLLTLRYLLFDLLDNVYLQRKLVEGLGLRIKK